MKVQATIEALLPVAQMQPVARHQGPPLPPPTFGEQSAASPEPSENEVMAAVEAVNRTMARANAQVQFAVDKDSGRTLIRIVDTESRQLIRQIPSEEMLVIARNIEKLQGLIVRGIA